jgi:diacylglycerol O-acyltransferase / wax synthase
MTEHRLTPLDASFLELEDGTAHMHVASVMIFEGSPPSHEELLAHIEARLHLVPRYRRRLAFVPLGQGRPRWVDDPHFNLGYHVREAALPAPGTEEALRSMAARVFAQQLDRDKPLWEMLLVEGLQDDRFAVLSKSHHALVDGVSGVDILSVLFGPPGGEDDPVQAWLPRPTPTETQLLTEALVERATQPAEALRSLRALARPPRRAASSALQAAGGALAFARSGFSGAPASPYNAPIGPHRRFAWQRASLDDVKRIRDALGGTVNDVMLTLVTRALRRHLQRRGIEVDGLELRALVPVSVRDPRSGPATGARVEGVIVPLPVGCTDPRACAERISMAMEGLRGHAVGARELTEMTGFAPPTILDQAARLSARQRPFNLVVTNVPGPQVPLELMGRRMREIFPMVPLAPAQALAVAILSYDGRVQVGLVGDFDALADLDSLAEDFAAATREVALAAGVTLVAPPRRAHRARRFSRSGRRDGSPGHSAPDAPAGFSGS